MTIECNRKIVETKKGNKSIRRVEGPSSFVEAKSNQELIITCWMKGVGTRGKEHESETISINHITFRKSIFQHGNGMHFVFFKGHTRLTSLYKTSRSACNIVVSIDFSYFLQINWFQFRFHDCFFNLFYTFISIEFSDCRIFTVCLTYEREEIDGTENKK